MDKYAKKNISTKQSPKSKKARFSGEDEYPGGSQRNKATPTKGPKEADTVSLLDFSLPKEMRLRKRGEFQRVYDKGRRIKGRFMTAFILPSETSFQRIGITASKKAIGNAVKRNRAKRLLREAFRLSKMELGTLDTNYDWVLNARGRLSEARLEKPLNEFREIVDQVRQIELGKNKDDGTNVD